MSPPKTLHGDSHIKNDARWVSYASSRKEINHRPAMIRKQKINVLIGPFEMFEYRACYVVSGVDFRIRSSAPSNIQTPDSSRRLLWIDIKVANAGKCCRLLPEEGANYRSWRR